MAAAAPSGTSAADRPVTRRPLRATAQLSLRWRLTLLYTLAFATVLVGLLLTLHGLLINTLLRDADEELSDHAERVATLAVDDGGMAPAARLRELLRSRTVDGLVASPSLLAVRDMQGRVIAQSSDIALDELAPARGEIGRLRRGETTFRTVRAGGQRVRIVTAPIRIDGRLVGLAQAGEGQEQLYSAGDRLQVLLIIEAIGGIMVAAALSYAMTGRSLRPLAHAGAVAADIEANDLARRIGLRHQPAEVQRLVDTFDAMLDRLEDAFAQQRGFVLDVSHELRTPLTALRGNIDVLMMEPGLPGEVGRQLERMSAETGRLARLAENLLLLGQADAGRLPAVQPVELDLLALEVVQQLVTLKPGVRLRMGHEDQVTVPGDRDLLKQLLLNLVENGLRYTPSGGQVSVSIARQGEQGVIEVTDTGHGIAAGDLPHIFERYYQSAHTNRRSSTGAGIGLAIAAWVARVHGGEITVESSPGAGSRFCVRLPLTHDAAVTPSADGAVDASPASSQVVPA